VTRHLLLKDKNDKDIVYGNEKLYKGINVGYYHTWCVVEHNGEQIIVDPALKYNKLYLKKKWNIKFNEKVPDTLISVESKKWNYEYITDDKLVPNSKFFLKTVDKKVLDILIASVAEAVENTITATLE